MSPDSRARTSTAPRPRGRSLRLRFAAVAVVAAGSVGGTALSAAPASAAGCPGANTSVRKQGTAKSEKAVRCLVNQRRRSLGLSYLRFSAASARTAQSHTNDMVRNHYFSHYGSGGSSISDRISASGLRWRTVGENIAVGQRTPNRMFRALMRSPEHCQNMMSNRFTAMGVGASRFGTSGYSGPTWTQVFVRPKGKRAPGGPHVRCG